MITHPDQVVTAVTFLSWLLKELDFVNKASKN